VENVEGKLQYLDLITKEAVSALLQGKKSTSVGTREKGTALEHQVGGYHSP